MWAKMVGDFVNISVELVYQPEGGEALLKSNFNEQK